MRFPSLLLSTLLLCLSLLSTCHGVSPAEEYLSVGDNSLASDDDFAAIEYYEKGVAALSEDDSLATALSLYTNLGTAFSSTGNEKAAIGSYRNAILLHSEVVEKSEGGNGDVVPKEATDIAAQAAFFLGMSHEAIGNPQKAVDAYSFASSLDEYHWSSLANLGSVYYDSLKQPAEAIEAYNKAYAILTQREVEPTDPPHDPTYILSELQYRIGLAIIHNSGRKCAMQDDPDTPVDCKQVATHAFSLATQYNPENENAKHMLAAITADATVKRASNTYVTQLFDEYAHNFEHSLVDELGYTGFERLRRAFDRAFGGREHTPVFSLVIDAGCGTGLAGEQFRNVSNHLVGVDLSEAIIDEAKKSRPNLYDETKVGDVTEIFREMKPVSLIIAADSYIYFGDLVPLFQSMLEGLGDGGFAAFTLENVSEETAKSLDETTPDWRWQLTPSGRFAHRKEYVESVAQKHSFGIFHYEPLVDFRYENGVGVQGHIFVIQKLQKDL